ncbi:flagellar hook-basal body complex protein FliE [Nocardioides sp. TRM66260-LWL]|uniref:flagellar hook-basal body complex protein FliE n=1 Tax=Nocardioides sp. TRM66260-LWL TaxID=2874478 RepID=UPI001CC65E7E|nr:flagellar hook-basal body complex protein FliE [Nocardioides sp. TRM66260-LWL]MBZ5735178.1 flagellar hook-basal body complex protein FliE [Nocardioides sp. TRM66260-LWL]
MSVNGIEAVGFTPMVPTQVAAPATGPSAPTAPTGPNAPGAPKVEGPDFGQLVADGLQRLDGVQRTSDRLAVQAASGTLTNLHDYTIAATQAAVTTQVTVAVRNKAVEAFNEIMRMQV